MLLVTTPIQPCAVSLSNRSRRVQKVVSLDNGQREKRRWLQNNIKQKAGATHHEGSSEVIKEMDKAEVAHKEWQA